MCLFWYLQKISNQNLQPKVTRQYFVGQNPCKIFPKIAGCPVESYHWHQGAGGLTALMHAAGEDQTDVVEAAVTLWFLRKKKNATTNWLDGVEDLSCLMGFWGPTGGVGDLPFFHGFWGPRVVELQMSGDYEGFVLIIVHGLVPSLKLTVRFWKMETRCLEDYRLLGFGVSFWELSYSDAAGILIVLFPKWLGGGFKYALFANSICGNDPFWRAYFSDGLKPPTRAGLVATRPCHGFARSRRVVETPRLEGGIAVWNGKKRLCLFSWWFGDVSRILLPWDSSPLHHKFGEYFSNRLLKKIKDMGSKILKVRIRS